MIDDFTFTQAIIQALIGFCMAAIPLFTGYFIANWYAERDHRRRHRRPRY